MSKDNDKNDTEARTERDIAFVRALAEVLREHDLTEIEVCREYGEDDEIEIRLVRGGFEEPAPASYAPPPARPSPAAAQPASADAPAVTDMPDLSNALTSPMVGTVYLAPEPGAGYFVSEGDTVSEGQTVLIIEAMKTMNQIPSPRAGKVKAILVENAEPVEFGAPLIIIE